MYLIDLYLQVKIWFQNRRTKWKKQDNISNAEAAEHKVQASKNGKHDKSSSSNSSSRHRKSHNESSRGSSSTKTPMRSTSCSFIPNSECSMSVSGSGLDSDVADDEDVDFDDADDDVDDRVHSDVSMMIHDENNMTELCDLSNFGKALTTKPPRLDSDENRIAAVVDSKIGSMLNNHHLSSTLNNEYESLSPEKESAALTKQVNLENKQDVVDQSILCLDIGVTNNELSHISCPNLVNGIGPSLLSSSESVETKLTNSIQVKNPPDLDEIENQVSCVSESYGSSANELESPLILKREEKLLADFTEELKNEEPTTEIKFVVEEKHCKITTS